jgi:hypothetical protein
MIQYFTLIHLKNKIPSQSFFAKKQPRTVVGKFTCFEILAKIFTKVRRQALAKNC